MCASRVSPDMTGTVISDCVFGRRPSQRPGFLICVSVCVCPSRLSFTLCLKLICLSDVRTSGLPVACIYVWFCGHVTETGSFSRLWLACLVLPSFLGVPLSGPARKITHGSCFKTFAVSVQRCLKTPQLLKAKFFPPK